jgi:hypothetical protein
MTAPPDSQRALDLMHNLRASAIPFGRQTIAERAFVRKQLFWHGLGLARGQAGLQTQAKGIEAFGLFPKCHLEKQPKQWPVFAKLGQTTPTLTQ